MNKNHKKIILVSVFLGFSLLCSGQTHILNPDGSLTVGGDEQTFTSFVANNPAWVKDIMPHYNYSAPFTGISGENGGITASNMGANGRIIVNVYEYDPLQENNRGILIYGVRATNNGFNSESWPVAYPTTGFWKEGFTNSTNTMKLAQHVAIFKAPGLENCDFDSAFGKRHHVAAIGMMFAGVIIDIAAGVSIAYTLAAAPITGGGSLAAIQPQLAAIGFGTALVNGGLYVGTIDDLDDACKEAYTPYQPVIISVTIRNATFNSLLLPGDSKYVDPITPADLMLQYPVNDVVYNNAVVINNGTEPAIFNDDTGIQIDNAELTVNGDMLILGPSDNDNLDPLLGTADFQLYVGSMGVAGTDSDGNSKRAVGIVSENFILRDRADFLLPDFVFEPHYKKRSLPELESFITKNKHLPNIISQKEVEKKGYYQVSKMMMGQLQQLEELFLHAFEQESKLEDLKTGKQKLKQRLQTINQRIKQLEKNKNHD